MHRFNTGGPLLLALILPLWLALAASVAVAGPARSIASERPQARLAALTDAGNAGKAAYQQGLADYKAKRTSQAVAGV